ncbi:homocysteine S-methyltransferase family protein [Roseibium marinum]|uniref:S-methylmethionine-dependent homocysteine/selenocysteine methylase n=1 Tax=Roseibium marinum TaxID=281252 RepID=A0A2S3UZ29_9HYPH|nr:homocysteine S-methyltransferase family protein [Roseibium marinum]POF32988.1 S-methylmethionine-dependent homocysteine/selenocysteine methylase [Roseibium marinum]
MSGKTFPSPIPGRYYLTEGGTETEIMYKWGFELPEFAMFPLLEKRKSADVIRGMYRRYLDVVARYGHSALIGGFDYRASPDWGAKLGYSASALAEANLRSIQFLKDVAAEYEADIPSMLFSGYVGPRGDAYGLNMSVTEESAEEYHSVQIETLARAGVDLVWALTFNNPAEAIGVVRAARRLNLPVAVSFSLDSTHRLKSGFPLSRAIAIVDEATNGYPAFYSLNCSHPQEFEPALEDWNWTSRLRSIRPNAAKMDKIALCKLGHLEEGDPEELGRLMADVFRRHPHMDIWGGCCGTGHVHLEEIARHLPQPVPA